MNDDARDLFSDEEYDKWWRQRRRAADKQVTDRPLEEQMGRAWLRGPGARDKVLRFIIQAHPPSGFPYVLKGLNDPSWFVRNDAIIAVVSYAPRGFDESMIDRLKRITRSRKDKYQGIFAIEALDAANAPGLEPWLLQVAESELQWEVRKEALFILLHRTNREALTRILEEMPQHPDDDWLAEVVWRHARKWQLTPAEDATLLRGVTHDMQMMRRLADRRGPEDSGWAMSRLVKWVLEGIRAEAGDSDRIRRYLEGGKRISRRQRRAAIRSLGLIGDPTALATLEGLEQHRLEYVRSAARRALKKARVAQRA